VKAGFSRLCHLQKGVWVQTTTILIAQIYVADLSSNVVPEGSFHPLEALFPWEFRAKTGHAGLS